MEAGISLRGTAGARPLIVDIGLLQWRVGPSEGAAVEALFEARAESLEEAADTLASLGMLIAQS